MSEPELPSLPIPEPFPVASDVVGFSHRQMHAYGRACRQAAETEIERLQKAYDFQTDRLQAELNVADEAIERLNGRIDTAERELAEAKGYANSLAVGMWEKQHRQDAPHWKPLPDLIGLLTQIDNMVAGLRKDRDALRAQLEAAQKLLEEARDWLTAGQGEFALRAFLDHLNAAIDAASGKKPK